MADAAVGFISTSLYESRPVQLQLVVSTNINDGGNGSGGAADGAGPSIQAKGEKRSLKRKEQLCNDQTQYTGLADLGSIGTSSGPLIDEPPPLDVHSDDCAFPVKHHDSSEVASAVKNHPMFMKLVQAHYACRKMIASDEQKKLIDNELMKVIASLSMLRGGDDESRLDDLFLAVGVEKKTVDEMFVEYCSAVENFSNEMQEPYTRAQSAFNELRTQLASITSTIGGTNTMQLMEDLRANPLFMNLTAYQKCDVMKEHFKRRYADSIARIADEFMSQKRSKKLPESAIEVLKLWWHEHIMWPYPEEEDKVAMMKQSGLDLTQVSNWFINQRKRHWHNFFPDGLPKSEEEAREHIESHGILANLHAASA